MDLAVDVLLAVELDFSVEVVEDFFEVELAELVEV